MATLHPLPHTRRPRSFSRLPPPPRSSSPGRSTSSSAPATPPASPPSSACHRLHARRPLPRTDPPAQGGGARLLARRHVQPRRILPDAAGGPALLLPLDARDVLQPRQHQVGEHPHPRRHARRRTRSTTSAPLRAEDQARRRHRPADPRHRPHRAHRLQRAGQPAEQPHADGHARPHHPPRRRQRLLRRGERAAPGDHDGRRHHPRRPQGRPHGVRRAQGARSSYKAVEQPPTEAISASFLQEHPDATVRARRGRGRGTDRDQAAVGGRARATGRRSSSARPSSGWR